MTLLKGHNEILYSSYLKNNNSYELQKSTKSRYLVKIKKKILFLGIALCKFGHRKFDISKTITAVSFKLGQVIVDNEQIIK